MNMVCESEHLEDYLLELDEVNYSNLLVKEKIEELFTQTQTEIEKAKIAFEFVRDGYSLHTLNAVYFKSLNKWIRLDARGNKAGVNAQFSIEEEKLAFSVNEKFDEKDYPVIYIKPNPKTIKVLKEHDDVLEMYKNHLPDSI